ncbi:MAG: C45 family peptidase [Bryobacteraceae bacterium]
MPPVELTRRAFAGSLTATVLAGAPARTGEPSEYPLFRARGTHRELGRQHGEQAASRIKQHLDLICAGGKISREQLSRRALKFQPMFERICPHLLEEMRGLSEGARVTVPEAMACNIRGEIGNVREDGCTAYAIGRNGTASRELLAGQNSDMTNEILPLAYVLRLQPKDKPEVLIWTFGGMLGYHGMNSAGVANFANALGGGPPGRFAMPHYPVKRMMLECTSLEQVVKLLRTVPLASNGNYVLCDGQGNILDVEATTSGVEIIRDNGAGFLSHTNHFLCSRYARKENFDQSWPDSFPRIDKMNQLIRRQYGSLSVDDIKRFLRDHTGRPTSICRHDGESRTVASLISEPGRRRMHVAAGNPCQTQYITYSM